MNNQITFTNSHDAYEYANQKKNEGWETKIIHLKDKHIITLLKKGKRKSRKNVMGLFTINKPTKKELGHIFNAEEELSKAGVTFDTSSAIGGSKGSVLSRDWNLDWSLEGANLTSGNN